MPALTAATCFRWSVTFNLLSHFTNSSNVVGKKGNSFNPLSLEYHSALKMSLLLLGPQYHTSERTLGAQTIEALVILLPQS